MAPPKVFFIHAMVHGDVHGGGGGSERDNNSKNLCVLNSNNALFFISDVEGSTLLTN